MNLSRFIRSFLNQAKELMVRKLFDLTDVELCRSGYKTGNVPPTEGWCPYDASLPLTGEDAHFWLRAKFRTPTVAEDEYLILRMLTGREGLWDATNPQGLLYLNGRMAQGLDVNHTDAFMESDSDYILHNYLYLGTAQGADIHCRMSVCAVNRTVERLYYDIKVPFDACGLLDEDAEESVRMLSVLSDAVRLTDLREPQSLECLRSFEAAIDFLEREFYGKLCSAAGKPIVHCIGHTHIDVEWKWTRAQTREKIQRSFSTAKALMDRYPEYRFMLSQPELYRYLREEAPEKFAELEKLVREGRWEPEGVMYLEPDCNLTSGESLVRQILFGKRFFRETFGVESHVLFLPDVFGYSAALPQILRKSNVDCFVTSKISWNDTDTMPMDLFLWEGIDGSEILTCFMTAQDYGGIPGKGGRNRTTYNAKLTASVVKGTWDRFRQKEYTNRTFMTFGFGDGGGGPTQEMLETQRRTARGIPTLPVTVTDTLTSYLEKVRREFDETCRRTGRVPRWVGELYLEFHRGTYTSIGKVKKSNRMCEFLLGDAELLSVADLLQGGSYDAEGLRDCWRKLLHDQFHDILPGSSIREVYEGTDRDYAEIEAFGTRLIREKLCALASGLRTDGGILLFNPTGFARTAVTTGNGYRETLGTVPPMGWCVLKQSAAECRVTVQGLTAENDFYRLVLNRSGQVESLYDKRVGRQVLKGTGNRLVAYEDSPTRYDAWELEDHYPLKAYAMEGEADVTPVTDGTRAGFRVEIHYLHSTLRQTIWLYSRSPRIDFETYLDWHEHHQVVRAVFPLNVHCTSAVYDVQFGHVARATHRNTDWDRAKFEVYAHKWADLSESGYGVALLNNGKYGHAAEGSNLSLTLVKSATDPNPDADQGIQQFTYSLLPHEGDFRTGGVIPESLFLNCPLYESEIAAGNGALPERGSIVSCDRPNAVITALKKAEDGDDVIVRFYDAYDCKSDVTLTVPAGCTEAYLCDLTEQVQRKLPLRDGTVRIPVSNFEIITVRLKKTSRID